MLKLYFLVLKTYILMQKMLKSASYVLIYAANSTFLLEMAAILKNGRHFDILRG